MNNKFSTALRNVVLPVCLGALLAWTTPASADIYTVNASHDGTTINALCTLREALIAAGGGSAPDCPGVASTLAEIRINHSVPTTLSSPLVIDGLDVDIIGPSASAPAVLSGNSANALFTISNGAKVTLSNLRMTNGFSSTTGGAMKILSNAQVIIVDSELSNHRAAQGGGAIYVNDAILFLLSTQITDNRAGIFGGGIAGNTAAVAILSSELARNKADNGDGGGIHGSLTKVVDYGGSRIHHNQALNSATNAKGGGVYLNANSAWLSAALYTLPATTDIFENEAYISGGMHIENSGIGLRGTNIRNNTATQSTGGISIDQTSARSSSTHASFLEAVEIKNNTVIGNGGAGGLTALNAYLHIFDSSITGNEGYSGGLYLGRTVTTFANTTVSENIGRNAVGGIHGYDDAWIYLYQTTTAFNTGSLAGGISNTGVGGNGIISTTNSIASDNTPNNCVRSNLSIPVFTAGSNLVGLPAATDTCAQDGTYTHINVSAKLASLRSGKHSNTTWTTQGHPLRADSPAIDAGSLCDLPITDNRVYPQTTGSFAWRVDLGPILTYPAHFASPFSSDQFGRSDNGSCDLGALEYYDDTQLFVLPLPGGKSVVLPL